MTAKAHEGAGARRNKCRDNFPVSMRQTCKDTCGVSLLSYFVFVLYLALTYESVSVI